MKRPSIVLISESRGEFLLVERLRERLARRGVASRHVTPLGSDLTDEEREQTSGLDVLDLQPEYLEAMRLSGPELAVAVAREQEGLTVNLRRMWQADLRSWREGYPDEQMARIALGYLRALRRILQDEEPLGLWGEDGGHLAKQIGYTLCERLSVQLWFLWAIPLPGRVVRYPDVLVSNDRAELARFEPAPEEIAYASELIDNLRENRIQYAIPRDMAMRPRRMINFARILILRYVTKPPAAQSLYPWRFARLYVTQKLNAARLRRSYSALGDTPFVFYPVHVVHDTQVSVRAHQWENQLALIQHIATSLPYGYELAIKEHPAQVGALPPDELRSLLRRRPEVRLLDPGIHAHAILPRCAAVATINSTTGFEGLFFGKPVVTFGHSPYRGLGLTFDVVDPFESPQVIVDALRAGGPARDDVIRYVAFLHRRSTPGFALSDDSGAANIEHYAEHLAGQVEQALST